MVDAMQIKEHMEVVGSCGNHVGTVDHVEGNRIKLTKNDSSDGKHHYLPISAIASVEGNKAKTSMNHMEAMKQFQDA
ncbi:DUF2171 domain-containing protein [Pararoseomonas indoligenes]|uniref:DUF2171 domain-containing protein n=1 Tax=Roseomonas indoligenes TaxID=2820811 RepID=A0A940S4G9_9PROT|nr:DUF2171 domain-containing protein [Pararoseomonas indoligenes]MBP0491969.1 DUF2171 domain-containing protein [Pararoseomonas indoligenes]